MDWKPKVGTHLNHSRDMTAASSRRKGGARGGCTPKMRRIKGMGSNFCSSSSRGARHPEARRTELVHAGVSCNRVTSRTEPVPMVIASCAERRKVRIPSRGRASCALEATAKHERTRPTKRSVIALVPHPYSTIVAATSTPIEAHSQSTPSATPCRKASSTVAFMPTDTSNPPSRHKHSPNWLTSLSVSRALLLPPSLPLSCISLYYSDSLVSLFRSS
eukprot:scaffold35402_cov31-Tisochrysis_lutea.AAC.1